MAEQSIVDIIHGRAMAAEQLLRDVARRYELIWIYGSEEALLAAEAKIRARKAEHVEDAHPEME